MPYKKPHTNVAVRMPPELHERLLEESFRFRTSMNQLCISKLSQPIDPKKVLPRLTGKCRTKEDG